MVGWAGKNCLWGETSREKGCTGREMGGNGRSGREVARKGLRGQGWGNCTKTGVHCMEKLDWPEGALRPYLDMGKKKEGLARGKWGGGGGIQCYGGGFEMGSRKRSGGFAEWHAGCAARQRKLGLWGWGGGKGGGKMGRYVLQRLGELAWAYDW